MRVLMTGAPGWLGDRFLQAVQGTISELRKLQKKMNIEEIRCLVHPDSADRFKNQNAAVKAFAGDITDKNSLQDFFRHYQDAVLFHMAGLVHATRGIKQFFEINVEGTRNLLDQAIQNGVRRIVAISSNSPAGCNPDKEHLFTEEAPYRPFMAYGRSKMQMEQLLHEAFSAHKIETVILRPCWFYGPGQPPRQTLFFP